MKGKIFFKFLTIALIASCHSNSDEKQQVTRPQYSSGKYQFFYKKTNDGLFQDTLIIQKNDGKIFLLQQWKKGKLLKTYYQDSLVLREMVYKETALPDGSFESQYIDALDSSFSQWIYDEELIEFYDINKVFNDSILFEGENRIEIKNVPNETYGLGATRAKVIYDNGAYLIYPNVKRGDAIKVQVLYLGYKFKSEKRKIILQ